MNERSLDTQYDYGVAPCDLCKISGKDGLFYWSRGLGCDVGQCDTCNHVEVIPDDEWD